MTLQDEDLFLLNRNVGTSGSPSWKSYSIEYDELKQDILGNIIVDKVGWVDDEAKITDATAFTTLFWC